MKVLKWCGRHTILTYWILLVVYVAISAIFYGVKDAVAWGEAIGTLFVLGSLIVWIVSAIVKKLLKAGAMNSNSKHD